MGPTTKEKKELSLVEKWNEQMTLIEKKTGIHGVYVIILLVVSVLFVYLNIFDNLITNLVGTVYPAFWTMKSIETKGDDDKQWLTYWVVFASFTIVDMFSAFIVKFVPFYFLMKIIFLIWLFMPNSHGATLVYHLLVVRVFKSFESDIDNAADKVKEYTNEFVLNNENVDRFKQIKNTFTTMKKIKDNADRINKSMTIDKEALDESNDMSTTTIDKKKTVELGDEGKKKRPKIISVEDNQTKSKYKKLKTETGDSGRKIKKNLEPLKTESDINETKEVKKSKTKNKKVD